MPLSEQIAFTLGIIRTSEKIFRAVIYIILFYVSCIAYFCCVRFYLFISE